ncbi:MAG: glycine dehydrogenase (aminomethyl-transferring) [Omnitrophica WOR_2 bacterium RIFCSPLOWO2_12_FULL_63_16]|nr:MAG: glycine dehydrogenase (aminomethyl-transferring) [Omnitrophica WOR_2 bacterium RIFCSPLOWO2_12_FULL_63_16]
MDYTPHTDADIQDMLQTIGVGSPEDLLAEIPQEVRCRSLNVPAGLSETEVLTLCEQLAASNRSTHEFASFLGFGAAHHAIPTIVDALSARGEWLTPYTPYQAEASQGTLQMIYEFQTMICELMGMEVANASLYDGASALAEAATLALRVTGRRRLLIGETVHPHYRQVVSTYVSGFPCVVQELPAASGVADLEALSAALNDDVAAVILQQPNVFGCLEPMEQAVAAAHQVGALGVASVSPISLGLLQPPGAYGADIATAEGRSLGSPVAYGGPGLGLLTTTQALLRKIPGRIAGCTVDQSGRRSFTLTLQTREQHIRREKATSNVCTNEGWLCLRATIFLSFLGPEGFRELAQLNAQKAHELHSRLVELGFMKPLFDQPFFHEFAMRCLNDHTVEEINRKLLRQGLIGGLPIGRWYPHHPDASLWCATETIAQTDIDRLIDALKRL